MKKAWLCIAVCRDKKIPEGADNQPREAVRKALKEMGFEIITLSTGWNIITV